MICFGEERICIKFCFKPGKTNAEINKMLKEALRDDTLGKTQSYARFIHFKNGRISVDNDNNMSLLFGDAVNNYKQAIHTSGILWDDFITHVT